MCFATHLYFNLVIINICLTAKVQELCFLGCFKTNKAKYLTPTRLAPFYPATEQRWKWPPVHLLTILSMRTFYWWHWSLLKLINYCLRIPQYFYTLQNLCSELFYTLHINIDMLVCQYALWPEASSTSGRGCFKVSKTHRQTYGYGDSMTEPAQCRGLKSNSDR